LTTERWPEAAAPSTWDDEGNPGERKVLIENGVLKGYLYDT